jgi:predicted ATPase
MSRRQRVTRKQYEKEKIEFKIDVHNFGPIGTGEISLKPLTVFIGPNNSGKSYLAKLIKSIFESLPIYTGGFIFSFPNFHRIILEKEFINLKSKFDLLKEGDEYDIPKQIIKTIINLMIKQVFEKVLSSEISRLYDCSLDELIMIGKNQFSMKIGFGPYSLPLTYSRDALQIGEYLHQWDSQFKDFEIKVKMLRLEELEIEIKEEEKKIETFFISGRPGDEYEEGDYYAKFMRTIFNICSDYVLRDVLISNLCYYLPGERSGILQIYKAFIKNVLKQLPLYGKERVELPEFSGFVTEFIASIVAPPKKKGFFYQLAQEIEKELLKGEIIVPVLEDDSLDIKFRFRDTVIPLNRTSSSISELAAIILYLKHYVEPRSILIVEEPEAHLHPKNQLILAKYFVKLVRKGVYILLTTHSDFLLEQINNFILLSKVSPIKRVEKYGYDENDYLKIDEIATYVFNYDQMSEGYEIEEVEITEEDGISPKEFDKINLLLYEEMYRLQKERANEK